MDAAIFKIIPVILIFVLGYALKRANIFKKEDAEVFLKVVFYVAAPALIILSLSQARLSLNLAYVPLIAVLIIMITYSVAFFAAKSFRLNRPTFGAFLIGPIIINDGFVLPFIIAAYGMEGLPAYAMFNLGNVLMTFTFVYYFACRYGSGRNNSKDIAKKIILSPPLWALAIALSINLAALQIPTLASDFLASLGNLAVPLIMLSLGIYFSPKFAKPKLLFSGLAIRMLLGLMLGYIFASLFNLEGLSRTIVLLCAAAPVGYNTITFSSLENLDKELAANLVSLSILAGLVLTPILMIILG